jgi:uncharacterized protein YdeI (YjbR/CyaY-like superfamily)
VKPRFFASPSAWRAWLERYCEKTQELWVGFHKRSSGKASITWPEAVDQALCFGWIDGVRKSIDETSYTIRFTARRARSIWSAVNIRRVEELNEAALMRPAGLKAFQERTAERSGIYAYEQKNSAGFGAYEKQFRANKKAWKFFQAQPPWYRRTATWWVISAKKEDTRLKRLATLMADSEHSRTIRHLTRK